VRSPAARAVVVGLVCGLAVVGLHLGLVAAGTSGLGFLWPLAAVGAFAAGAFVGGRRRADLHVGHGEVEVVQLRRDLEALRARVRRHGGRLPGEVQRRSRDLLGTLDLILQRGEHLSGDHEALHVVGRTIRDYLPTSLETYLNLPRAFAMQRRIDGRRTAYEELVAQLTLLQTELSRVADAVYQGQARSLSDQSRFLEEKFRRSELDLE
jgi:hypothetical protein